MTKKRFIASTEVPLIEFTFDVYVNAQHFEIVFTLKDDQSKTAIAHNLRKTLQNFALVESEFSDADYLVFLAKVVSALDVYRNYIFDAEKVENISQIALLELFFTEIAMQKSKRKIKQKK